MKNSYYETVGKLYEAGRLDSVTQTILQCRRTPVGQIPEWVTKLSEAAALIEDVRLALLGSGETSFQTTVTEYGGTIAVATPVPEAQS